ncbi:acyltransferase [Erythrobacter sp.]|uniref:acyltransferase family protein n=1 Tax=Erythrobacter sp. TaxID=1042 RepID=UPI001AFE3FC0|nr:acyltransferase [Erythrobacter sp.]MBO6526256.1 acyltransferase [Erythrobacter sp.]MBO6530509.1 acyltransferase [Erythrobacter sp.]
MGRSTPADGRFATMDALRGVAAVCVMLFHAEASFALHMTGGFLAVDLFFCLSGFVIAHAYEQRLRNGFSTREFLLRRAVRLWPMLALGAVLGIMLHGGHAGMLFLLPNWKSPTLLFPANPPLWSLMFEMLAYFAFALLLYRLKAIMLLAIMAVSALVLINMAFSPGRFADFGADWPSIAGGLARVGYGFTAGVLIYRRQSIDRRHTGNGAWLPIGLAVVGFLTIGTADNNAAVVAALIGVPLIVAWTARIELPQRRSAAALGDLSYPLYCVHVPLIALAAGGGNLVIASACAAIAALSLALDRFCDRPARVWLLARVQQARPQAAVPAA